MSKIILPQTMLTDKENLLNQVDFKAFSKHVSSIPLILKGTIFKVENFSTR